MTISKKTVKDNVEIRLNKRITDLYDLKNIDEIVLGDFLHLERMSGTNVRCWSLIVTREDGEQLNLTITEKDGKVNNAFVYEDGWAINLNEWGVK